VPSGAHGGCTYDDQYEDADIAVGDQWLQFDVGPPGLVTGVVTRGRGDSSKRQWVTRYKLAYSNDTRHWIFYNDASHLDPKVCSSPGRLPVVVAHATEGTVSWNTFSVLYIIFQRMDFHPCPKITGVREQNIFHIIQLSRPECRM